MRQEVLLSCISLRKHIKMPAVPDEALHRVCMIGLTIVMALHLH
jgi:hypothetical protein